MTSASHNRADPHQEAGNHGVDIDEFYRMAMGGTAISPYPHQVAVAEDGLPQLLRADTGTGKTEAVILGWLWRRHLHPDPLIRKATPHWLVYALPMRVLVEQTELRVRSWLEHLNSAGTLETPVEVHALLGGTDRPDDDWRTHPGRDAVVIGTVDMLLSRALNRGYTSTRWSWPIAFGAFNSGCHWVFDEIQLLDSALVTSRQLQAFRDDFGTAAPTSTTWMSATVDTSMLDTIDHPWTDNASQISLDANDAPAGSPLARRLRAPRTVREIRVNPEKPGEVAAAVDEHHRAGTLTLAVCNTVSRAVALYQKLARITSAKVLLVHSRFRPDDRQSIVDDVLEATRNPTPTGSIVVTTQALEAGVDISATTLVTEVAPWASIVQRSGRCNREGADDDALLLWIDLPERRAAPYATEDLAAAADLLREIDGGELTPPELSALQPHDGAPPAVLPTLRRRDLVDLFDTGPDLSGNDIDVSRYIRAPSDESDVALFWRHVDEGLESQAPPDRQELCQVPIGEVRSWVKRHPGAAWSIDHLGQGDGHWVPARPESLRVGEVVMLGAEAGGYDPEIGWNAKNRGPVPPVLLLAEEPVAFDRDFALGSDPASRTPRPVLLTEHLRHVKTATDELLDELDPVGLGEQVRSAARTAARLHDLGKAHLAFRNAMHETDAQEDGEVNEPVLAKSGHRRRLHYRVGSQDRRGFRHELASLLALDGPASELVADHPEAELIRYLVAAHHGRVRLSIRSTPSDLDLSHDIDGRPVSLGVVDGDPFPPVIAPLDSGADPTTSAGTLDLDSTIQGDAERPAWSDRAVRLRDRGDLGVFRLGWLEMVVRLADWRASHGEQSTTDQSGGVP